MDAYSHDIHISILYVVSTDRSNLVQYIKEHGVYIPHNVPAKSGLEMEKYTSISIARSYS